MVGKMWESHLAFIFFLAHFQECIFLLLIQSIELAEFSFGHILDQVFRFQQSLHSGEQGVIVRDYLEGFTIGSGRENRLQYVLVDLSFSAVPS
jgi:hypothetical protein